MGYEDRKPTAAELEKMKEYVAEGMEHGAMGMSTGLGYPPGIFSEIDELVELYKVVAKYGGIHATHMRDEGDELLESIDEAIAISRRSGASSRSPTSRPPANQIGARLWPPGRSWSGKKEGLMSTTTSTPTPPVRRA